jgi:spermidine synthase
VPPLTTHLLVFLTGMAGLAYQVAWQRYLSRLLGSDTAATAIILGVFLGGLAAGYAVFGLLSARIRNAFRAYGLAEAAIGLWGLAFPLTFEAVSSLTAAWSFSPTPVLVLQGVLSTVILIGLPTVCMGSTVPLLTRGMSGSLAGSTAVHARVYTVNTAGAFAGTLITGFLLVPGIGLPATVRLAAGANLLAAFFFLLMPAPSNSTGFASAPAAKRRTDVTPALYTPRALCLMAFLGGFATLTLENVLIRFVNLSFGSSSYSFSLIVAAFILSIAAGSAVVARARSIPRPAIFLTQVLAAILLAIVYATLDTWPYYAHLLRIAFPQTAAGFWLYHLAVLTALTLLIIAPVGLLGAAIPLLFDQYKRSLSEVGSHSGRLLAVNTSGNLLGSIGGGVLLYLLLDNPGIYLAATAVVAVSAVVASRPFGTACRSCSITLAALILLAIVFTPFLDPSRLVIGTFRLTTPLVYSHVGPDQFFKWLHAGIRIDFTRDGPDGSTAVVADLSDPALGMHGDLAIFVNGKSDSAVHADAQTLRLSAHLIALLARDPRTALVIGLGTGVTAGELALYPWMERIDVAEISSGVVESLPFFSRWTHAVHEDPRLTIIKGDALRILGRSSRKWDLILSEPSNPWVTGVDMLFTAEFYSLARSRLNPDGLFLQWIHVHEAGEEMIGMVLSTVLSSFPHCRIFLSQANDLLILASEEPLGKSHLRHAALALENAPAASASLAGIGMGTLPAILLRELWNSEVPFPDVPAGRLQTMDHPRLHYAAGKSHFLGERFDPANLLLPQSADLEGTFLLPMLDGWPRFPMVPGDIGELIASASDERRSEGILLPTGYALKLRAHLHDPAAFPLSEHERRRLRPDLVRPSGITGGVAVGSQPSPLAGALNGEEVGWMRSWVVPYPLIEAGSDRLEATARTGSTR